LKIIEQNLGYIKRIAAEQVVYHGKDYKVEVSLKKDAFPIKNYGNIVLAAGKYDAVKIIIGEGEGHN